MFNLLLNNTTGGGLFGSSGGILSIVLYVVVFIAIIYFLMIRPNQKETKRRNALMQSMEVGDLVVTTSGFYGEIIDVSDEDVIVEFGSNKNCRIPMKKAAIETLEKKNGSAE